MARKSIPAHPARDRSREDESLLLRSAESLGRMIGSLQRQLDVATRRLTGSKPNGAARKSGAAKSSIRARSGATSRAAARERTLQAVARERHRQHGRARRSAEPPGLLPPPDIIGRGRRIVTRCPASHIARSRAHPASSLRRTLSTTPTCCNRFSATRHTFQAARRLGSYSRRTSTRSRRLSRPPGTSSPSARNRR